MKKESLNISGMHCTACKTLIETEVSDIPGVKNIKVDHKKNSAEVEYDEKEIKLDKILDTINSLNYTASPSDSVTVKAPKPSIKIIGIILAVFIFSLAYYLINVFGGFSLMAKLNEPEISVFLLFAIGFIASFHCVGMCGGIITSFNTRKGAEKRPWRTNLSYNFGRIISYTTIGILLGAFGSIFNINPMVSGIMALLAASFMFLFGLSLAFEHKPLKKLIPVMPDRAAKMIFQNKKHNSRGPFFIGLATALMPCGPLQALQIFALTSGSAFSGGMAMFIYALGTTPLLLGLGRMISWFSTTRIKAIMRFSGVLVVFLAIIMLNRSLSFFGTGEVADLNHNTTEVSDEHQIVKMDLTYSGYSPNVLYIEPEKPVRWIINVKQMSGCTNAIMIESLGIKKDLVYGENIIDFTPPKGVKEIDFSCWMRMVWGKFIVATDNK